MKLINPFKKKTVTKVKQIVLDPLEMPQPTDVIGYLRRGWAFHARDEEEKAEADFRRALELDSDSVDANYNLGLVLKARGRAEEAVASFRNVVRLLEAGRIEDKIRTEMLRRLSLGHINELTIGDWDLEKEVWHKINEPPSTS